MTDNRGDARARRSDRAGGADAPEPLRVSAEGAHPSRGQRFRHVKRGSVYEVVGVAELQINFDLLVDGSAMVVYRGEDGKLWAREEGEFTDGRFERIADAPPDPSDLRPWGWAPGSYVFKCSDCPDNMDIYEKMGRLGDKRSWRCKEHAIAARDSDGSPKGGDGGAGSVHDSAGPQDIAQPEVATKDTPHA